MSDRRPMALRAISLWSPQQPLPTFFPWRSAPFLARQQSRAAAALHVVPAPAGCRSIASGLSPAIEAAMGAARNLKGHDNGDHRNVHFQRQWLLRLDPHPNPECQGQDHPGRESHRQGPALPHLCQHCRAGRRLAKDGQGHGARLPLDQARRSELSGSDLRHPDRGRRPGRPPAHLVPTQSRLIPQRRLRRKERSLPCTSSKPSG
jgi:hypothetical protein